MICQMAAFPHLGQTLTDVSYLHAPDHNIMPRPAARERLVVASAGDCRTFIWHHVGPPYQNQNPSLKDFTGILDCFSRQPTSALNLATRAEVYLLDARRACARARATGGDCSGALVPNDAVRPSLTPPTGGTTTLLQW